MLTVKQIERLWDSADFGRLARELLEGRVESSARAVIECGNRVACAALALIRVDEFGQNFHPLCPKLLRAILASQDADGGWSDPATTALVLRALSLSRGQGVSIDRGLAYLEQLRKQDGSFPRIAIRRTEGDPMATALVAHHLSRVPAAVARLDLRKTVASLGTARREAVTAF